MRWIALYILALIASHIVYEASAEAWYIATAFIAGAYVASFIPAKEPA